MGLLKFASALRLDFQELLNKSKNLSMFQMYLIPFSYLQVTKVMKIMLKGEKYYECVVCIYYLVLSLKLLSNFIEKTTGMNVS